ETVGTRSDPHDDGGNALANLPRSRSLAAAARATAGAGSSLSPQGLSKRWSCHSKLVLQALLAARKLSIRMPTKVSPPYWSTPKRNAVAHAGGGNSFAAPSK